MGSYLQKIMKELINSEVREVQNTKGLSNASKMSLGLSYASTERSEESNIASNQNKILNGQNYRRGEDRNSSKRFSTQSRRKNIFQEVF